MKNFDQGYETTEIVRDDQGKIVRDAHGDPVTRQVFVSRNERATRERWFTIGGESFTYRASVTPEATLRWSKLVNREYRVEEVLRDGHGTPLLKDGKPIMHIVSDLSEAEALQIFDETVLAFLEPGQEEKWRAVRSPDNPNPLNLADLTALIEWLFEEATGRPTQPPPASTAGPGGGGTTSTGSSPPPTAPAEALTT
jgi:hypothetical protein